jgi:hypothetical protein
MFALVAFAAAVKKKEEILDLDGHRFRHTVFHRDLLDIWVSALSSPDYSGHAQAMSTFDDAFKLGKGFLKFAYLDCVKNTYIPRRLGLTKAPHFCVFYAGGEQCRSGNMSAREIINWASSFLPDFTEAADEKWLDANEQNPTAILFTERETTPLLWVAVSTAFRRTPLKIGISRDHDLATRLGVTKFPTVLLHNLTHNIVYEGENEYLAMKTNFKKFMMKRLFRIRSAVKVKPLNDYPNSCVGHDTICIIQAVEAASPDMEAMRWKHRTTMFEFFYGTTGGYEPGAIVVKWPARNRRLDVAKIQDLEGVLTQILNGTAVWTETEPEVKATEEEEPEAFDDIL